MTYAEAYVKVGSMHFHEVSHAYFTRDPSVICF